MGALTLKSFPFELRGWDIEKFESLDPTDCFGSNTRVYVDKDQIVLIEPDYNSNDFNTWLTDKGRQFFDGMFNSWYNLKKDNWIDILNSLSQTIYIVDQCNRQQYTKKFFTIAFENLSLEVLNLLLILSQNYAFVKLRRTENFNVDNDLEFVFQLNAASNKIKLNNSTLCILISSNPRYEGYYLNLNLRQRYLKGNFKCLNLGSVIDLTFPVTFLGSNTQILKDITEGNNLICQDLKESKNPLIIYNSELFKRNDNKGILRMLKFLNYANNFDNNGRNGLNLLSSSLCENGVQLTSKFPVLSSKDLNNSSVLYLINISENNAKIFKKITELKLLNYILTKSSNNLFLDQNYKVNNNLEFTKKLHLNSYKCIPTSIFYENEETFMNTEGFIKRTAKLISLKKTKNNWQILRKFLKHFKNNFKSLDNINNQLIYFNPQKLSNFKNYTNFNYYAIQSLTNLNFYLTIKTEPTVFHQKFFDFKLASKKLQNTKTKYWLDDFFMGGKDEYSQNSLTLSNCSRVLRSESTNFF